SREPCGSEPARLRAARDKPDMYLNSVHLQIWLNTHRRSLMRSSVVRGSRVRLPLRISLSSFPVPQQKREYSIGVERLIRDARSAGLSPLEYEAVGSLSG